MSNKFNDFSRFKNNQLRSYFRKKEDNEVNLKNPFSSSILSALTIAILWSAKDNYPEIITGWLKILFYPFIIIASYLIVYFFYRVVFDFVSIYFQRLFNRARFTKKSRKDKYYLDIFKFEVVNQVSLALSIISHKIVINNDYSEVEKKMLALENKFYVVEAFYHLNDALDILQTDLLLSPFYKKIMDDNYTKINQRRIKELVDLSTSLYFQFKEFWESQGEEKFYEAELQELQTIIKDVESRIS